MMLLAFGANSPIRRTMPLAYRCGDADSRARTAAAECAGGDFDQVAGIAVRESDDVFDHGFGKFVRAQRHNELYRRRTVQLVEAHGGCVRLRFQLVNQSRGDCVATQLFPPIGEQQGQVPVPPPSVEELYDGGRCFVGPVEVVQYDDGRLGLRDGDEQVQERFTGSPLQPFRLFARSMHSRLSIGVELWQKRQEIGAPWIGNGCQDRSQPGRVEGFQHWTERNIAFEFTRARVHDLAAPDSGALHCLFDQPGFSQALFTVEGDDAPGAPGTTPGDAPSEAGEFVRTPGQGDFQIPCPRNPWLFVGPRVNGFHALEQHRRRPLRSPAAGGVRTLGEGTVLGLGLFHPASHRVRPYDSPKSSFVVRIKAGECLRGRPCGAPVVNCLRGGPVRQCPVSQACAYPDFLCFHPVRERFGLPVWECRQKAAPEDVAGPLKSEFRIDSLRSSRSVAIT